MRQKKNVFIVVPHADLRAAVHTLNRQGYTTRRNWVSIPTNRTVKVNGKSAYVYWTHMKQKSQHHDVYIRATMHGEEVA